MEISDEIAEAARSGDPDALSQVWRALSPRVLGYLRARGVDDPEGLTSEVFLAVLPRLGRLSGGSSGLRTLVFSVAHARSVDDVRRRARRPEQWPYEPEEDPRTTPGVDGRVVADVAVERAMTLLGGLSEEQRTVVSLRVVADLSLEQTAEVVGKSTGAVKQLQRRGLLALRSMVQSGEVSR